MKKLLFFCLFFVGLFLGLPTLAKAESQNITASNGRTLTITTFPDPPIANKDFTVLIVDHEKQDYFHISSRYWYEIFDSGGKRLSNQGPNVWSPDTPKSSRELQFKHKLSVSDTYSFVFYFSNEKLFSFKLSVLSEGGRVPIITALSPVQVGQNVEVIAKNLTYGRHYTIWKDAESRGSPSRRFLYDGADGGSRSETVDGYDSTGEKTLCIAEGNHDFVGGLTCVYGTTILVQHDAVDNPKEVGPGQPGQGKPIQAFEPLKCNTTLGPNTGINTALGCIPVSGGEPGDAANAFAGWFLRWAIGISGGIAFLLMIFASFQIMTASGNPEKVQAGRELLTSAISGLILIIFSVFLLKLIGVKILKIF